MIKVIHFMHRKIGWSAEDFQAYWRSTHGDLVRKIPGIQHYTQCHTLLSAYKRQTPPAADGVEELSFHSLEAAKVLETSKEGQAAFQDFINFADSSRLSRINTEEILIKDGTTHGGMVKNIEFVTRKPGMPLGDFRHYWKNIHGPIAAKIGVIKRYVQSHTLLTDYDKEPAPAYDGVAETWFDDTAAMRRSATTPEYAVHHADMFNFLVGELPFIITKEIEMI